MSTVQTLKDKVLNGYKINLSEAESLIQSDNMALFNAANEIREHFFANEVVLCSIVNAKSGYCPEDCGFCGQASQFTTHSPSYKLLNLDDLKSSINEASNNGASEFSFVTSGRKISNSEEIHLLAEAINYTKKNTNMEACSSLGLMAKEDLHILKEAGMDYFHHNLETARSHFPNVINSHSYDDEIDAVRNAKELGLHTCCGGIFGMGESWDQRLELAFELRDLDVDSVPINFLNPIKGTPLSELPLLEAFEALKIVALYRFIFPKKNLMVMGGREKVLRDLQSWIFFAGANGMLIGNYLITNGRSAEDDQKMLKDLGLKAKNHCTVTS